MADACVDVDVAAAAADDGERHHQDAEHQRRFLTRHSHLCTTVSPHTDTNNSLRNIVITAVNSIHRHVVAASHSNDGCSDWRLTPRFDDSAM